MSYSSRYSGHRSSRRRKGKLFIIGGVVLALVVLLALYFIFFTGSPSPTPYTPLNISSGTAVSANDSNLYYISGTSLVCADLNGTELWSSKFSETDLQVAVSNTFICVYNSSVAYVIDMNKNILFTVPSSRYTINSAKVSDEAVVLYSSLADSETPADCFRVFDATGSEIDRIELDEATLIDYGFYDGSKFWYMSLDTTGVRPISRVITHDPLQQQLTGTSQFSDELIDKVFFFSTEMYVSGTTSLSSFDAFGTDLDSWLVYGMQCMDVCTTDSDLFAVYCPRSDVLGGSLNTARIITRSGTDTLIQLPSGITSVFAARAGIYCFGDGSYSRYRLTGEFIETVPLDYHFETVERLTNQLLLLRDSSASYILKIA